MARILAIIAAAWLSVQSARAQSLHQLGRAAGIDPSSLEAPQPPRAEPERVQPQKIPLKETDEAPNFGLKDLEGTGHELMALRGRVVLVEFWASWCGPCRRSMPTLVQIHEQYKDKGLVVLAISLDRDEEDVRAFLKDNPVPFPVLFEPESAFAAAEAYAVETIPRSFVVGRDGWLVLANGSPQREVELVQAVEKALLAR